MMSRSLVCALIPCLLALILLPGCGGPAGGSAVQVTVASAKMKLEDTDSVEVVFTPEGKGEPATASGSFKSQPLKASRSGTPGVIPGKYKLTVKITPYAGMASPQRDQAVKEFNNLFNASSSKLSYEVTADPNQSIAIDLDTNAVTKK